MRKQIKALIRKSIIILLLVTTLSGTSQVTTTNENYTISLYSDELPTLDPVPNNG